VHVAVRSYGECTEATSVPIERLHGRSIVTSPDSNRANTVTRVNLAVETHSQAEHIVGVPDERAHVRAMIPPHSTL
jgi:hypothetical protein